MLFRSDSRSKHSNGETKFERKVKTKESSSVYSTSPMSPSSVPSNSETKKSTNNVEPTSNVPENTGNFSTDNTSSVNIGGGWEEVKLPDGRSYYYHNLTRVSRWDKPSEERIRQIEERIANEKKATDEQIARRKREREAAKLSSSPQPPAWSTSSAPWPLNA